MLLAAARAVKPGPHQQQCRSNVRLCCQKRQQCRTSFALKFRPFDKVERCFDTVAQNGNIVEATGNKVACCFDNVASTFKSKSNQKRIYIAPYVASESEAQTLLLVWTGLHVAFSLTPWTANVAGRRCQCEGDFSVSGSCTRFACFSSKWPSGEQSWWRLRTKQSRWLFCAGFALTVLVGCDWGIWIFPLRIFVSVVISFFFRRCYRHVVCENNGGHYESEKMSLYYFTNLYRRKGLFTPDAWLCGAASCVCCGEDDAT